MKDFDRLANPRNAIKYKHDTLLKVMVAKRESKAASISDFPLQSTYELLMETGFAAKQQPTGRAGFSFAASSLQKSS